MPTINVEVLLADLDAVLAFAVKKLPGDTRDAKKANVYAFINPRVTAYLASKGASEFITTCVVDLLDVAVDAAVAAEMPAA